MERSPLAGKTVKIREDVKDLGGMKYHVEDWSINVMGRSWMNMDSNPACLDYAIRSAGSTPIDNLVLYGKIGGMGKLIHISEIEDV